MYILLLKPQIILSFMQVFNKVNMQFIIIPKFESESYYVKTLNPYIVICTADQVNVEQQLHQFFITTV